MTGTSGVEVEASQKPCWEPRVGWTIEKKKKKVKMDCYVSYCHNVTVGFVS